MGVLRGPGAQSDITAVNEISRHDSVQMMRMHSAAISGASWVALVLVVSSLESAAAGAGALHQSSQSNSDAVAGGGRQMDSLLATSAILPGYLALRMADIGGYMVSDIAYNITRMIITFMFLPSYLFSLTR